MIYAIYFPSKIGEEQEYNPIYGDDWVENLKLLNMEVLTCTNNPDCVRNEVLHILKHKAGFYPFYEEDSGRVYLIDTFEVIPLMMFTEYWQELIRKEEDNGCAFFVEVVQPKI